MKRMLAAALVMFVAACAPAPAGPAPAAPAPNVPAPLNPVGTFDFQTMLGGNSVGGSVELAGQPGAYTGVIRTSITPDIPVTSVAVNGQELVVAGNTPDGVVTLHMTFTGDAFTGHWELNGGGGDNLSGRRVAP